MTSDRPGNRRVQALKWALRLTVLGLVGFFVVRSLVLGLADFSRQEVSFSPGYLAAGIFCLTLMMVAIGASYHAQLASLPGLPSWTTVMAIAWISRTGKYVPGKVFTIAGAAWLLSRRGVPGTAAAGAILVNSALNVVTGMVIAAPLLLMDPISSRLPFNRVGSMAVLLAAILCLHPRVVKFMLDHVLRIMGKPPVQLSPSLRNYLKPTLFLLLQWLFAGLGLWCIARSLVPVPLGSFWLYTAVSALAVTIGFLALLAPAGIGVREGVFLLVLTPVLGATGASIVTVVARLLHTFVEIVLALIGVILLRGRAASDSAPKGSGV